MKQLKKKNKRKSKKKASLRKDISKGSQMFTVHGITL